MGLLDGKKALVFGVANDHSIAWGIARAFHEQGATLGFSSVESLIEQRVRPLADGSARRSSSRATSRTTPRSRACSTAGRPSRGARHPRPRPGVREARGTRRARSSTRPATASRLALDVSAYSLVALARAARPLLKPGASMLTLTYYGSEKVVANYNVMGVAKAALEASVRYLAADLGPEASGSTRSRPGRSGRSRRPASVASRRCTARSPTSHHSARTSPPRTSAGPRSGWRATWPRGDRRGGLRRRRVQRGRSAARRLTHRKHRPRGRVPGELEVAHQVDHFTELVRGGVVPAEPDLLEHPE